MNNQIIPKKDNNIRKKANILVKGGLVIVNGHRVKMKQETKYVFYCFLCPMDSICKFNSEMHYVCHQCDIITGNYCYLEPAPND